MTYSKMQMSQLISLIELWFTIEWKKINLCMHGRVSTGFFATLQSDLFAFNVLIIVNCKQRKECEVVMDAFPMSLREFN